MSALADGVRSVAGGVRSGRRERHRSILDLIAEQPIGTQEELAAALHARGVEATQATVSRDLRDLGLVRVHDGSGVTRYVTAVAERSDAFLPLHRVLNDHLRSVEFVEHLGVLRTWPASAPMVAGALDAAGLPGLAGTIAGDDTVLVVARSRAAARRLQSMFDDIMGGTR